jgi:hypothetical protein
MEAGGFRFVVRFEVRLATALSSHVLFKEAQTPLSSDQATFST